MNCLALILKTPHEGIMKGTYEKIFDRLPSV